MKRRLDVGKSLVIVDVREPDEYADWRIEGSVNVPLDHIIAGEPLQVPGDAEVVTVCRSGARSERARQALVARGVTAFNMEGGMIGWNGVYDTVDVPFAGDADVVQLRRVGKGCLSYLIVSGDSAAVIDPTVDVDVYLDAARDRGARITRILDTHAHADHVSGSRLLQERTGATYVAPDEVGPDVPHETAHAGEPVSVGAIEITPLATPGHTAGSMTYRIADLAFTGDTLFVESVGRPDLGQDPRPNAKVLHATLHDTLLALPDATRVLPGHYGDAVTLESGRPLTGTLGTLKSTLPALAKSESEFVEWVVANALPKPGNFDTIKKCNKGLVDVDDLEELKTLEAGPNRCAVSE